jgi:hypothetical protein
MTAGTPLPVCDCNREGDHASSASCIEKHQQLRGKVNDAIQLGARYQWSLLIGLWVDKFLSDIIQSILDAIYLESQGSI